MASLTAARIMTAPAAQPTLSDDVLEDIFLRLDDAADLVRAYASCISFRRVVSGRLFRRRYGSLYRPPVLGFLSGDRPPGDHHCALRFHPAEAPAAAGVARAADFAGAFRLSDPGCWRVRDFRDGRILLSRGTIPHDVFEDLIVYDPLHWRHIKIGSIPWDIDPSGMVWRHHYEPFLDPATEKEKETLPEVDEDLPLRVICNVITNKDIRTFVFTPVTGKWRAVTSFPINGTAFRWMNYQNLERHYSGSCFCLTRGFGKTTSMLVLDTREMRFSVVDLPPKCDLRSHTVVEAGEGRLGLLILGRGKHKLLLYSKSWPNNDDCIKDWQYDNVIPLDDYHWSFLGGDYHWSFLGGAEGYALLEGVTLRYPSQGIVERSDISQYFIVEIKTLSVKRLCAAKPHNDTGPCYLYSSFPPPLSLPSL